MTIHADRAAARPAPRPVIPPPMRRGWGGRRPAALARAALARAALACAVLMVALCVLGARPGRADPAPPARPTWRVATRVVPPLVIDEGGRLTGFSVELWGVIAKDLGVGTQFVLRDTLPELFEAVSGGEADLAVAAISITAEREQRFDFSVSMLEAGLQIAVRPAAEAAAATTLHTLEALVLDPASAVVGAQVLALVLAVSALVWWVERRHAEGMAADATPARGFAVAVWWTLSSLAAQAEEMPRSAIGRAVAVVWLFACIAFVTWFTASLASTATVERLRGEIAGPRDLPGKRVATLAGSTSAVYLADHFAVPVPFASLEEAAAALERGAVAALVYDAPALRYYAAREGRGRISLVGPTFHRESYGILFPTDDPRRKRVNAALLTLREDGRYEEIHARWFGSEAGEAPGR